MTEAARLDLEETTKHNPSDESAQRDLSRAWCLLADLDEDQFHIRKAFIESRRCEEIGRAVLRKSRTFDSLMLTQQAVERLGTEATAVARFDEALAAFDEDQKLLDEMVTIQPNNPALHRLYALLAEFRASVYFEEGEPNLGDPRRCLMYARQYLKIVKQTVEKDPNNTSAQRSLATALYRESIPLRFIDTEAAVVSARESVRLFDNLVASGSRSFLVLSRRARAQGRLSEASLAAGHPEKAVVYAEESLAGQRVAAAHDRRDPRESLVLALALVAAARAYEAIGRGDEAQRVLAEADLVSSTVLPQKPDELDLIIPRSIVLQELAKRWREDGDDAKSHHFLDAARALWRDFPEQSEYVHHELARLDDGLDHTNDLELASRSLPSASSIH